MTFEPWGYNDRIKYGKQFADMHNSGWSMREISEATGESERRIRLAMDAIGYDPMKSRRPPKPRVREILDPNERPAWSRPDETTLRLVREARKEMERAGW